MNISRLGRRRPDLLVLNRRLVRRPALLLVNKSWRLEASLICREQARTGDQEEVLHVVSRMLQEVMRPNLGDEKKVIRPALSILSRKRQKVSLNCGDQEDI